jgi:hypothetical protein
LSVTTFLSRIARAVLMAIADALLGVRHVVRAVAVRVLDDGECEGASLFAVVGTVAVRLVVPAVCCRLAERLSCGDRILTNFVASGVVWRAIALLEALCRGT